MNLVAKEYVAAQDPDDPGVLILSTFAGAARELESAVIVNPYDVDGVAEALHRAHHHDPPGTEAALAGARRGAPRMDHRRLARVLPHPARRDPRALTARRGRPCATPQPAECGGACLGSGRDGATMESVRGPLRPRGERICHDALRPPVRPRPRLYGGDPSRRVTLHDLARAKERGERWPMLTAYDAMTARLFDEAGIPVLLVGDSAANVVYGYDTTLPVTMDELVPLVAAVTRATRRALVVADMPFGSYQASPDQALARGSPLPQGGRRARGQARRRPADAAPGRGARRRRHPGDGPPRPHPAVGQRARRLPRPGARRRR